MGNPMMPFKNDIEKYRIHCLDIDMLASLAMVNKLFDINNMQAVVELATIFTLSPSECIQLAKFDLGDINSVLHEPPHVLISAAFSIKRKSCN